MSISSKTAIAVDWAFWSVTAFANFEFFLGIYLQSVLHSSLSWSYDLLSSIFASHLWFQFPLGFQLLLDFLLEKLFLVRFRLFFDLFGFFSCFEDVIYDVWSRNFFLFSLNLCGVVFFNVIFCLFLWILLCFKCRLLFHFFNLVYIIVEIIKFIIWVSS